MSENTESTQPPDPFESMIRFYETWSKNWSQAMSEAGSSEKFAEMMGQQMGTHLEGFTQARGQFGDWMDAYLKQMNLPARDEVTRLAERLTGLEIKLDDLDAKLDQVLALLQK